MPDNFVCFVWKCRETLWILCGSFITNSAHGASGEKVTSPINSHFQKFIVKFPVRIFLFQFLPPDHNTRRSLATAHIDSHLISVLDSCLILVGNPEGKRPLGRPRRRWVDSIKIDLREIGWDGGDCIDLAQDRDQWRALVRAVMNLRVP
jgi:hypothetical protein